LGQGRLTSSGNRQLENWRKRGTALLSFESIAGLARRAGTNARSDQ